MLHRTHAAQPGQRTLTFLLPLAHPAGATSVVGNFNDWTPGVLTLEPDAGGMKSASVVLPSDYIAVFRYLGENDWWFDEPEADFVDGGGSVVVEHVDAESMIAEDAETPASVPPAASAPTARGAAPVPTGGVRTPAEHAVEVTRKHQDRSERAALKAVERARRTSTKLREKAAKAEEKRRKELAKAEEKRVKQLAEAEEKRARKAGKGRRGAATGE